MRNGHAQVTEMIRAARTGNSEALDRLLALYRNYLTFLARRGLDTALRVKAAPSDLVQETMPSRAAEQRERSVILADALAALGDEHRRVVVLRDIEQLEWEQVARRMGRTPGAVRMLWVRALEKLAPLIERSRT